MAAELRCAGVNRAPLYSPSPRATPCCARRGHPLRLPTPCGIETALRGGGWGWARAGGRGRVALPGRSRGRTDVSRARGVGPQARAYASRGVCVWGPRSQRGAPYAAWRAFGARVGGGRRRGGVRAAPLVGRGARCAGCGSGRACCREPPGGAQPPPRAPMPRPHALPTARPLRVASAQRWLAAPQNALKAAAALPGRTDRLVLRVDCRLTGAALPSQATGDPGGRRQRRVVGERCLQHTSGVVVRCPPRRPSRQAAAACGW